MWYNSIHFLGVEGLALEICRLVLLSDGVGFP